MKKILAIVIILASLLSLVSCGEDYPPVASTKEESQVVMTVTYEGKKYEVKYELYRALFLNLRESVDGGDESVWTGENKGEYINRMDELIKARAAEIYALLHVADKIGIDVYSTEYDGQVAEYIKASVEGGIFGNTEITGFDGDYEKYIAHLSSINLNYSVQDLLIRYALATEEVFQYYAGNLGSEEFVEDTQIGKLEYTREDVYAFYDSDECVRVLRLTFPEHYTATRIAEIQSTLVEKAKISEDAVAAYMIQHTTAGATDVKNGEIIARHSHDREYYAALIDAAFGTEPCCVSEVISIYADGKDASTVIYRAEKNALHFETRYSDIVDVYLQNEIGKIIDTDAAAMAESMCTTDVLADLDRSKISMP